MPRRDLCKTCHQRPAAYKLPNGKVRRDQAHDQCMQCYRSERDRGQVRERVRIDHVQRWRTTTVKNIRLVYADWEHIPAEQAFDVVATGDLLRSRPDLYRVVFETTDNGAITDQDLCDRIFRDFNVGQTPDAPSEAAKRQLRSMSVGDLVLIDGRRLWICKPAGWARDDDLTFVAGITRSLVTEAS